MEGVLGSSGVGASEEEVKGEACCPGDGSPSPLRKWGVVLGRHREPSEFLRPRGEGPGGLTHPPPPDTGERLLGGAGHQFPSPSGLR